jgi:hypothetical protein
MARRITAAVLVTALLLAVPALIITSIVKVFSNPCFFRQFPPPSCTAAQKSPGLGGWALMALGVFVLAGVLAAAGARKQARR